MSSIFHGLFGAKQTDGFAGRLVAYSLQQGKIRNWDYVPDPEHRYVRGDFWDALDYGKVRISQAD